METAYASQQIMRAPRLACGRDSSVICRSSLTKNAARKARF